MFFKMNDQRSTKDQLADLAVLVADNELLDAAAWIRAGGNTPVPPEYDRQVCRRIANQHGLYDAADWIRNFASSNE